MLFDFFVHECMFLIVVIFESASQFSPRYDCLNQLSVPRSSANLPRLWSALQLTMDFRAGGNAVLTTFEVSNIGR